MPENDPPTNSPCRYDTSLLMAAAALLIINSHLEHFYPRTWMAADGLLGVMIFYMLSGFGVQSSLLSRKQGFFDYSRRRFVRLYPPLWIVVIATLLLTKFPIETIGVRDWIQKLLWTTDYTYYKWVVPFYIAIYFVGAGATTRRYAWLLPLLFAIYAASVVWDYRHSHYLLDGKLSLGNLSNFNQTMTYALAFFGGGAMATLRGIPELRTKTLLGLSAIVMAAGVAYVGAKFGMVVHGKGTSLFFVLHFLVLVVCVASFYLTSAPPIVSTLRRLKPLWMVISLLSAITLETYIVHEPMAYWPALYSIRFPLNIAVILALTIVISIPLHIITARKSPFRA